MFQIGEFKSLVETIYYAEASIDGIDFGIIVDDNIGDISIYRKSSVSVETMDKIVMPYRDAILTIVATRFSINYFGLPF